jgi:hypothetical protein
MSSVFSNSDAENIGSRFRKDKNKNIWIPAFAGMTEGALQRRILVYT